MCFEEDGTERTYVTFTLTGAHDELEDQSESGLKDIDETRIR